MPWRVFASYMCCPAVIGIPLGLTLRAVRNSILWDCGLAGLAACCALCSGVMFAGVMLFDQFLPESSQRKSDLVQKLRHVWTVPRRPIRAAVRASR